MRWLHRRCDARELSILRERDSLEAEVIRLRKQLEDLSIAHQGLVTAMATRSQQDAFMKMLGEMFEEIPGDPQFLTPDFKDRQGVVDS